MTPPRVSVIVPVFNKAQFLAECLDSILAQSLREIELICIDDASSDGSRDILLTYQRRDSRIIVAAKTVNSGPGPCRNQGLEMASGEFVQFTDADDLLPQDALEVLYEKCQVDAVEVVRGGVDGFHEDHPTSFHEVAPIPALCRVRPLETPALWMPWWHPAFLFSRRFLDRHQLRYPDLRCGEDPVFLAKVLVATELMSTVGQVTYHYRQMPLESKGRATYFHLSEFLRHAEMVKDIYMRVRPQCWSEGYAPILRGDIGPMISQWSMTDHERQAAAAEMNRILGEK